MLNDSQKKNPNLDEIETHIMKDDLNDLENMSYQKKEEKVEVSQPKKAVPYPISSRLNSSFDPNASSISKPDPKPSLSSNPKMDSDPKPNQKPSLASIPKPDPNPNPNNNPKPNLNTSQSPSLSSKTSESPFFNQKDWGKKDERIEKEIYISAEAGKAEAKKSGFGRVIFVAIFVSILLIFGVGGYYFWMTRIDVENEIVKPSFQNEIVEAPREEVVPDFSSEMPNYLMLNDNQVSQASILAVFKEVSSKIIASGLSTPVEFIVTDSKNMPLTLNDFSLRAGIVFPIDVTDNFGQEFSLFFYNEDGKVKMGLVIDSENDDQLKAALLEEEESLIASFDVFYLGDVVSAQENVVFKSSTYMNQEVRYHNLDFTNKLSMDYTIREEKVYFATSEKALREIIEYVSQEEDEVVDLELDEINQQ
jgi:hypothetical protein